MKATSLRPNHVGRKVQVLEDGCEINTASVLQRASAKKIETWKNDFVYADQSVMPYSFRVGAELFPVLRSDEVIFVD